ncbi:MAG: hypothetical protein AB1705_01120 [Verrucomicrobiota bacterium]
MASEFKKLAIICEEFAVPSPAQQLVDRFLIGYPRDGQFHRAAELKIAVSLAGSENSAELQRRHKDFPDRFWDGLTRDADAVLIVLRNRGAVARAGLTNVLESLRPGTPVFIHGALAMTGTQALGLRRFSESRNIPLVSGSALSVTWRLPEIDLPQDTPLKEALIVVQGEFLNGEIDALESLLPIIERRRGGESGVRRIRYLQDAEVWRAGDKKEWSWPLLASAISRSDSPQGDPVTDGRTQDLVGLGLVPKLARHPRAWLLDHRDGLRTTLLVLDDVVADYNFAVQSREGKIWSAQLYRPPRPAEHEYSRLAEVLEDYFGTGKPPWSIDRSCLIAGLLEAFTRTTNHTGKWIDTLNLTP